MHDVCRVLMEAGASLTDRRHDGTALKLAFTEGQVEAVRLSVSWDGLSCPR